jgi:hypothetical protein
MKKTASPPCPTLSPEQVESLRRLPKKTQFKELLNLGLNRHQAGKVQHHLLR